MATSSGRVLGVMLELFDYQEGPQLGDTQRDLSLIQDGPTPKNRRLHFYSSLYRTGQGGQVSQLAVVLSGEMADGFSQQSDPLWAMCLVGQLAGQSGPRGARW